jgi:DNA (cytosine-5)-methyltransferase 1
MVRGVGLRVLSLFSGCGGLDLGFVQVGYSIVWANDIDHWACETYKKNIGNHIYEGDVADIDYRTLPKCDIVIGGPPCQDFSQAGTRNGNGERANLTPLFAKVACELKPKWIVMENVNTILSIGEKQLSRCMSMLHDCGYGITATILNSVDFGVPQTRKRLFLIARKNGRGGEMESYIERLKVKPKSVRDYASDVFESGKHTNYYYRHPLSYGRRAVFSIDEPSPTVRGVNRPIPKGYRAHKNDAIKDLCNVRPLSYKERAAIQTFPATFEWCGSRTEIEKQIGNAVPPMLGKAIAKSILLFEKEHIAKVDYEETRQAAVLGSA